MTPGIVVHQAGLSEAERVGRLAYDLLAELYPDSEFERSFFTEAAKNLLGNSERVWAFLATANDARDVGLVTLNECAAIYAGGRFGEISEMYVVPDHRSKSVGALLLDAAVSFGRKRGWPNIEVGAPSRPGWQRTLDFYLGHGFEEVGPRLDLELTGGSST
jgi:GNAT superfamily N-acetyltransferase